jgi:hypothetical protein
MASNENVLGMICTCSTKSEICVDTNKSRKEVVTCKRFLTLGFGCEHEGVLGFQGKNIFSYFQLGVFTHDGMERRKSTNGDAVVFMTLNFLCCFLLFGMCMLLWILLDTR